MRAEFALRHLLLRHLEQLQESVPRETFLEATRSLRVDADRSEYSLRWQRDGEIHQRAIPRGDYTFYSRGDRQAATRSALEDLRNLNDERARALAEEILGAPPAAPRRPAQPGEPFRALSMAGALATGLVLLATDAGTYTALGVALLILIENAPGGRLAASALLVVLAAWGAAAAGLLGALAYAALQALDPDPRERRLRVALCALAALLAATRLGPETVGLGLGAVAVGAAAMLIAGLRSLWGSHARSIPLALPFLFAGLYFEGRRAASWAGLGCAALGALGVAWAHRWLPVQHGRLPRQP